MIAHEIARASFSGHETFPFRYAWLPKAIRAVQGNSEFFGSEDAMVILGVGKNMVASIRHWALTTDVLREVPQTRGGSLEVTEFGERLLGSTGWDPYLEDAATLWLLHWQIGKCPGRATTWYWFFSHLPQP